jgi:hypothetical protein
MLLGQPRVVEAARGRVPDPPEPWEVPGGDADFREFTGRRLGAFPSRPRSHENVPAGAREALEPITGPLELTDMVVVPRSPRLVGRGDGQWAVTPTSVLAVGDRAAALWVDGHLGPAVVRSIPIEDVAACIDRTVLLSGRLEIVGPTDSLVIRYNTVGRVEVRALLMEVRRGFWPPSPPLSPGPGLLPEQLPHKWMALLHSADVQPVGIEPTVVVAGDLRANRSKLPRGIALLGSTELLVATEPAPVDGETSYGVDLVAVPRARLAGMEVAPRGLRLFVDAGGTRVEIRVPAEAGLTGAVTGTLGPLAVTD